MVDPDIKESVSELVEEGTAYVKTYTELLKVKTIKHSSNIAGHLVLIMLLMLFAFVGLIFMSAGLAAWLNKVCSSDYAGYYIVGGVYLLAGIVLLMLYNKVLLKALRNMFVRSLYDEDK